MRTFGRWVTLSMVAGIVATLVPAGAVAQQQPAAIVTQVDGIATVTRRTETLPVQLSVKSSIYIGDRIATGEQSLLKMLIGGRALLTARELTTLQLSEQPNKAIVTLDSGRIRAATLGLSPNQVFEIRTPTAIVQVRGSAVRGSGVIVEVTGRTTDVDCEAGNVLVSVGNDAFVPCPPGQGFTINDGVLGPIRAIRIDPLSLRALQLRRRAAPVVSLPADWTLLIDRGVGFERWVGNPSGEGYVAEDHSYENVALGTCEAVARALAKQGARTACARPSHSGSVKYVESGHLMARGPLAGRFVVFDPSEQGAEWHLWIEDARGQFDHRSQSVHATLSECQAAVVQNITQSVWRGRQVCVRLPGEHAQYLDKAGHVMVQGAFARGLVVYDTDAMIASEPSSIEADLGALGGAPGDTLPGAADRIIPGRPRNNKP